MPCAPPEEAPFAPAGLRARHALRRGRLRSGGRCGGRRSAGRLRPRTQRSGSPRSIELNR